MDGQKMGMQTSAKVSSRVTYSRAEKLSDAVVHIAGLSLVLMAVPVLIVVTVLTHGDVAAVMGVSIYGGALVAMIFCSGLYNVLHSSGVAQTWTWILKRLDHSAIYVKIAGTYTPFTLLSGHGAALTLGVWGAALVGVTLKLISPERFRFVALALYLGMGWAVAVLGGPIFAALPPAVFWLACIGGGLYSLGVVFYLWTRLPFHYTIWHVFVLCASLFFYAAVMWAVVA